VRNKIEATLTNNIRKVLLISWNTNYPFSFITDTKKYIDFYFINVNNSNLIFFNVNNYWSEKSLRSFKSMLNSILKRKKKLAELIRKRQENVYKIFKDSQKEKDNKNNKRRSSTSKTYDDDESDAQIFNSITI